MSIMMILTLLDILLGTKKHELHKISAGNALTIAGEDVDVPQEENAPCHHNWLLKVKIDNTRTDNGAVHTFARTEAIGVSDARTSTEVSGSTRMPHLHRQREQAAFKH
jgi:hypothetical protein